ncbi:unnamed protein product, partial [Mesorhabditis spiculigera]
MYALAICQVGVEKGISLLLFGVGQQLAMRQDEPSSSDGLGEQVNPPFPDGSHSPKKDTCVNCEPKGLLEEESEAAIKELSFAVTSLCVSEMLPRTENLMFLNLTTKEGTSYCIELTEKGWRIASNRHDCMNGDFRKLDDHIQYFSTLYQLKSMTVFTRKIAVMGFPCVGKSSITLRFVTGEYTDEYETTIEDLHAKKYRFHGQDYSILITDTTGQQEFSLFPNSCSYADGFILVYSIDDRRSFEIVQAIYDKIVDNVGDVQLPIVVVGNKTDLKANRVVSREEGQMLANKWNAVFVETSAKENLINADNKKSSKSERNRASTGEFIFDSVLRQIEQSKGNLKNLQPMIIEKKYGQGFAAMSVDFGSKFIKVGLVKPGVPMEIVLNKESRRKTPAIIHMRNGERAFGDPALALAVRYPSTVYGNLIDLVAKELDHPLVQQYLADYPHLKLVAHANRSTVAVPFGEETYSIESVLAMILSNARDATEAFADQSVKDAVISVPVFFNQAERQAIVNAAKIAKLNLLQLINDGTAAGLGYGVFRRKEITEKPQRLLIYDMGAAKTTATLLEYKVAKDKKGYKEPHMTVLGVGFDRTLGGEVVTLRLRELLIKKFRENYKTKEDVTTNQKALAKIYKEAERVKQVLSANADHYAQIESVHEDVDMRVKVTRDELNILIADLEPRIGKPVLDALDMAGLTMEQVDQVVLMGAGTRTPKVQEVLQLAIGGKELGRFLNTDEAIAMGGLYQAAHLSKGFKVKTFHVEDLQLYPILVHFTSIQKDEKSGVATEKAIKKPIFGYKSIFPTSRKVMSFTSHDDDFSFGLHYGDLSHFSEEQRKLTGSGQINEVSIKGLKAALEEKLNEDNEFKGVKAAFSMDYSGVVQIEGAEAIIEKKSKGVVESLTNTITGFFSKDDKKEEGEPTEEKADEKPQADTQDSEEKKEEEKPATEEKTEDNKDTAEKNSTTTEETKSGGNATAEEKKKKEVPAIVKVKLTVEQNRLDSKPVDLEERKASIAILEKFEKEEKLRAERHHAENELESYAFEASLLPEEEIFIEHSTEAEREKIIEETKKVRTWLEDETDPTTPTGDFKQNYHKIKDLVTPVKKRIDETQNRPAALEDLEKLVNTTMTLVSMTRANITETTSTDDEKEVKALHEEVNAFDGKVDKLVKWLLEKKEAQAMLAQNEDSVLKTEDLKNKASALQRAFTQHFQKMTKLTQNVEKARKKAEREAKKKEEAEAAAATETETPKPEGEKVTTNDSEVPTEKPETEEPQKSEL